MRPWAVLFFAVSRYTVASDDPVAPGQDAVGDVIVLVALDHLDIAIVGADDDAHMV